VHAIAFDGVAKGADDVLLTNDRVERLGTVTAVEGGFGHGQFESSQRLRGLSPARWRS